MVLDIVIPLITVGIAGTVCGFCAGYHYRGWREDEVLAKAQLVGDAMDIAALPPKPEQPEIYDRDFNPPLVFPDRPKPPDPRIAKWKKLDAEYRRLMKRWHYDINSSAKDVIWNRARQTETEANQLLRELLGDGIDVLDLERSGE